MLLISRLRCWEESQFLTLLLQWLGRKELEQLFPTGLHLFIIIIILTIALFWLVFCILTLHIAYYLYDWYSPSFFIYSILFIWMHILWMYIYMTLQLKILTLNELWLSIFVTFSLEITLWPLNMICRIT